MTNHRHLRILPVLLLLLVFLVLAFIPRLIRAGDDNDQGEADQVQETASVQQQSEEEPVVLDKIVVTGSRLQREVYTSIQPLQIITTEGSREAGLVDTADILQQSTAATGQQIDLTFSAFLLDNGPGASTLSLRGLGASRTLLLLNGRRLAPSGVEGAPSAPDLNLIPSSMVERYEILLDGASSVYGSDAVAGVTNIIMRNNYDGFEFDAYYTTRDQGDGDTYTLNAAWGRNFDRGFFGIGVEYYDSAAQRLSDSDWTDECTKHREIDQNGKTRTRDQYYPNHPLNMEWDDCRLGAMVGRVFMPLESGYIYYTPGFSNGGWGNWSESEQYGFGVDSDLDGVADLTYRDYALNGSDYGQNAMLYPENHRLSLMAYGEYTLEGDMNNTPYFELNYNDRSVHHEGGGAVFFPWEVPATNPYNLCNPDAIDGVDCGLAQDALYNNPGYRTQFADTWEDLCARFGYPKESCTPELFELPTGAVGPIWTVPLASVQGDRVDYDTDMDQLRFVIGLKGDLPFVDWGAMNNWQYDLAYSYTNSDGTASRQGVRADRLNYSVWTSRVGPDGEIICGYDDGCVPVNMFAPSLYPRGTVVGDFATQAERDYVFDNRDFRTKYRQTLFTAFADGYLFELPGGTAFGGVGFEYRLDDIESLPNEVARDGLLWGFSADAGAVGDKSTTEFFGEIEMPLLAQVTGADSFVINLSARYTDDEIYGSDWTGSAKLGWRPIPSLLLRGTYGTSFRAPSLREVFLEGQTSFNNALYDPCVVPEEARGSLEGGEGYDPSRDNREPEVLENCRLHGVDPTSLGIEDDQRSIYPVVLLTGGAPDLTAETSASYTYGFAFDQPWSETFDLTFGATYWNIDIDDTIIEPSSQFLVNDCYGDEQLNSVFCEKVKRGADGYIELVDAGFINRDNNTVSGVDINFNYDQTFNVGARAVSFGADLVMTYTEEASETYVDNFGNEDYDDDAGQWGYPDWKAQFGLRTNIDDFRLTWVINYTGSVDEDPEGIDPYSDVHDSQGTGTYANTCLGPPDDVLCRDVGFGDDYWLHSASIYYYGDQWTIGAGIRNIFDQAPPMVDGTEIYSMNNLPIGYGYDLRGRTFFVNLVWRQ